MSAQTTRGRSLAAASVRNSDHHLSERLASARATQRLLFVDECRRAGNVGEAVIAEIACRDRAIRLGLVTAHESYVPLGDAAMLVLPSVVDIVEGARTLCAE